MLAVKSSQRNPARSTDCESSLFSATEYDEEFELLVNAYMRDMNHTSLWQAALNVAYATINVGIVALPFIAQESGVALFIIVMTLAALLSVYTSVMVISMANQQRVRTLEDLADRAFGPRGFFAVSAFQILFSGCLVCVTLEVFADIMCDALQSLDVHTPFFTSRVGMVLCGALAIYPLCLLKKSMASLRWTSAFTVFAVLAALLAVVASYFSDKQTADAFFDETSVNDLFRPKSLWFTIIFLASFVFSANQKVLTIYSSLRRRSTERWTTAVTRSHSGVLLLYLLFAIAGYLAKSRESVRLDSFNFFVDDKREIASVFDPARILVAVSLLLTIPVDILVATTTWRRLRSKYSRARFERDDETGESALISSKRRDSHEEDEEQQELLEEQRDSDRLSSFRNSRVSHSSSVARNSSGIAEGRDSCGSSNGATTAAKANEALKHRETDSLSDSSSSERLSAVQSTATVTVTVTPTAAHVAQSKSSSAPVLASVHADEDAPRYDHHFNNYTRHSEDSVHSTRRTVPTAHRLQSVEDPLLLDNIEDHLLCPKSTHALPATLLWVFCTGIAVAIQHWLYLVATVGTISVVALMFFFPSVLYFRLGLLSDFQARPIVASIVPNRFFMTIIAAVGLGVLFFDVSAVVCFAISNAHLAEKD